MGGVKSPFHTWQLLLGVKATKHNTQKIVLNPND